MRGDTATENETAEDHGGGAAPTSSGERRPSIATLQNMLKKVSQSPFHGQYQVLGDRSSAADHHQLHLGQNGHQEPLRLNPQKSTLDRQPEMKTVENGAKFSDPPEDLFQTLATNRLQGDFETPTWAQSASANGPSHDATLNSTDFFKPTDTQTQSLYKTNSPDLFKDEGDDPFQVAKRDDFLHAERPMEVDLFAKSPNMSVDPFKSPSNQKDDLFQSSKPMVNPFDTATTKEADLFQASKSLELNKQDPFTKDDLFVDPFPSPIQRDLSQDVSSLGDPFGFTPSKQYDPFPDVATETPDIFQPLSLNSPSERKLDMLSSPDLFKATPSEPNPATQLKSSKQDVFLENSQGDNDDILPANPFSRARNRSMMPGKSPADITRVPTFKRPPKPLPRSRPPRPDKPPKPEKPPASASASAPASAPAPAPANPIAPEQKVPKIPPKPAPKPPPKPVVQRKPPEVKPVEPENSNVFEDVLLIGQERCVEDWPEDSPELNPDFKPSGTFRLRRESWKMNSDGGSGDDQDVSGSHSMKKHIKSRLSVISRRGSKEKFANDTKEGKSGTLPRKSSKEYFSELNMSAEDEDGIDYKKHLKTKVNQLLRRASTNSFMPEGKRMNGHLHPESKDDDLNKKTIDKKDSIIRRWSEGTGLDASTGEEEEEGGDAQHDEKKKRKLKIKFVPQRGFAITAEKGAHGYTPRKTSKDKSQNEFFGAYGSYTPRKKSQDDDFEDVEAMSLQSTSKAAFMDDEQLQKTQHMSAGLNGDDDPFGMEDCKPKKPTKMKLLHAIRRSSKEDMLDQKKKGSFSAEELEDGDWMEDCKPKTSKYKRPVPVPRKPKTANGQSDPPGVSPWDFAEGDFTQTGAGETYDSEEDEVETCKPQKKTPKFKAFKRKDKNKDMPPEWEDPPGATSADFMSEAAKAEWLAAQMDERAREGLEDEDEDGDTDSLMEWWNTVEQWDEVPSDEEDLDLKEDECKSFTILADKVSRGLRVYNKVFTERAEVLWQSVITLHAIADDIDNFHHKAKIAGITGGTTTAVGGVAAIAGLVMAPFTFGTSLIITAVGVGVATAGGITSASAAISDNVHNMQDRKKVELVLDDYETDLLAIGKILHFVNQGLYKLRGHPFLRSGTQHYSEDWEIRRSVQMISLVDSPVMRGTEITDAAVVSVQRLFKGMDKYFTKDSRELKKGCKKNVVGQIKEVANVLNEAIVELNTIREELQDATGNM